MKVLRAAALAAIAAAASAAAIGAMSPPSSPAGIDAAFQRFWDAPSSADAVKRVDAVVKSGVTFDEALRRLKQGRTYSARMPGVFMLTNRTGDHVEHYYAINVPDGYDPSRRYQVRFQLHGGVMGRSTNQPRNSGAIGTLASDTPQFYVLPYGWSDAPWWSEDQLANLDAILDSLKRTYNIDENRVILSGVSDGATGAYYVAMRDTTPFASVLPLNGFILVLTNPDTGIRDALYPNNLLDKPMFVVNGGRDRLYPLAAVEPYVRHLKKAGVAIEFHPQPLGEHNTAWWPDVKESYEAFVREHPRDPSPATLTWETADLSRNRAHWLVIDKLGRTSSDAADLPDANAFSPLDGPAVPLFEHRQRSGRVDVVRTGNHVDAVSRGVNEFTLLISPDAFDVSQPITVTANGKNVFDATVQPSVATLMKWAARDDDRTMLYAVEIHLALPK